MKLRWWLLWLFASFLAGLGFLACALSLIAEPARADAPLIWGASNTAQMLNSGGLVAKDGSVYPKFTEKNYLAPGAFSIGAASAPFWNASSASVTCTTTTTGLPDASAGTALAVTGVSGSTDYCFANFDLDQADYNKKMKLAFDQAPQTGYVANDQRLDVYSCTVAWSGTPATTCSGTATRLPLSTDSSSVSALPNLTGTYRTTWDSPGSAAAHIQVRVGLNGTNTHQNNLAQIVTGPGVVTQGAVVTQWQSFTPTLANLPCSSLTGEYRRVGDAIEENIACTASGAATGTITASLPSGLTVNTSALASAAQASVGIASAGISSNLIGTVQVISSTTVRFTNTGTSAVWNATNPGTWASGSALYTTFTVPVNEWAGSGTVNLASNDQEFVFNTSATTTTDTTSFGYGPAGAATQAFAPAYNASIQKRVRFQTPIQDSDLLVLEFQNTIGQWLPTANNTMGYKSVWDSAGTATRDVGTLLQVVNSTDVDVYFYSGADWNPGAPGTLQSWASEASTRAARWRVRKIKGGQAVGFGIVQPGVASGLVSAAGVPGVSDNSNAGSGYVGEYVVATGSNGAVSHTAGSNAAQTAAGALTPGDWDCFASAEINTSTGGNHYFTMGISTTSGTFGSTTGQDHAVFAIYENGGTTNIGSGSLRTRITVASGSTATGYVVAQMPSVDITGSYASFQCKRTR